MTTWGEHGPIPDGLECMVMMDDITEEDGNYVEYKCEPSGTWKPALMGKDVVLQLQNTQFKKWTDRVKETDCQAELKRLLTAGPPIWLSDPNALALPEGDTHISTLWFQDENMEVSAMLTGAVTGEEREKLWDDFRKFQIEGAAEEEEAEAQAAAEEGSK
eukprot:CAMPEP_0205904682 /NCGR_PEP_ID=MMETSP1325-20131115/878_1 /ASSEMBLY_ACC=CAM_ASM_000708 /TAXON_ID=236786 /ORGANISM="Florenciella sp., Strain RCC1007" /LENGTH=159 /DNA_ID=CAMNT_0053270495 /DNA_START=50 /DNA_END=529 /DNA_ORIENTATION=+